MILAEVFTWWYTTGWTRLIHAAGNRVAGALEFFSVSLLLKTLFDPFRQIDAGKVRGSLDAELRAFGNRLFSRVVGFFVRTITIFAGLVTATFVMIFGLIQLVVWPLLPMLPLIGLIAMLAGWTL
jgi:hypothetical protein